MIQGESIICFGGEDWWYHHPHSKNHIMRRLTHAGNRVMFVNSISMGLPSPGSPDFIGKIKRKLRSLALYVRETEEGIIVITPVVIPFYSIGALRFLNRLLLLLQIRLLMIVLNMRNPVLWIAIPTAVEIAGRLGEKALIYQVSDKYDANSMDHAVSGGLVSAMHRELLSRADLIYFSGRRLHEEELAESPELAVKSKLLQQAVDYEHFSRVSDELSTHDEPADFSEITRPRLGYFGAIETWLLDQQLISYVSEKRPEWQWVLIGLKTSRLEIEDLLNVHYLGTKTYQSMPACAAAFDVCVLPWVTDNNFVNYGSAIKVREYMATGKPVVITPLYEYERFDGVIRIARDYDDFISKVEDALMNDSIDKQRARQNAVKDQTWDVRAEEVSSDIEAILSFKSNNDDKEI